MTTKCPAKIKSLEREEAVATKERNMDLSYKGEHGMVVIAKHPDESIKAWVTDRMREALIQEQNAFLQEVGVALRKMKPGQKRILLSRPIRVELQKDADKKVETND